MDHSETVQAVLDSAGQLEKRGNLESALLLYVEAEQAEGPCWPLRSAHARALYRLSRSADAEATLSDFVDSAASPPGAALNDLGIIKAEHEDRIGAMKCLVRALRCDRPLASPHVLGNLAHVLLRDGRTRECADACNKTLAIDPDETRAHYVLSLIESQRLREARLRPTLKVLGDSRIVQVFRTLLWHGQPMTKHDAMIVGEDALRVRIAAAVDLTSSRTDWGVLVTRGDELWCGFAQQCRGKTGGNATLIELPRELHLVQRRRWVRVLATAGLARIEVRSLPNGVEPFAIQMLTEINLSAGGVAVRTVPELPEYADVTVFLNLGRDGEIECRGQVERIGRPEAAEAYSVLVFSNMAQQDHDKIARFVNSVQLDRKRGAALTVR